MNIYAEFIEEDIRYLEGLQHDLVRWKKFYDSRVFDDKWPSSIRNVLKAIRYDIFDVIKVLQENIIKAEQQIKVVECAHLRQISENQSDAVETGGKSRNSDQDAPRTQPQDVGIA